MLGNNYQERSITYSDINKPTTFIFYLDENYNRVDVPLKTAMRFVKIRGVWGFRPEI